MKKIVLSLALFSAAFSFAQTEVGAKFGYGHLFTKYESSDAPDMFGGGIQVGGYYKYWSTDNIILSGEVLLTNRSWYESKVESQEFVSLTTNNEQYTNYSNYYIDIPLSVQYALNMRGSRYGGNKYVGFYAGPTASLLVSSKGTYQETMRIDAHGETTITQEDRVMEKSDLKDYFTPFQIGLHAGVQFTFEFGLNIDLRYQTGLMPASIDTEEYGLLKQGMGLLTVGYSFVRD